MNEQGRQPHFKWKPTLVIFVVAISALIIVNYAFPFFFQPVNEPNYTDGSTPPVNKTNTKNFTISNITIIIDYKNGTNAVKPDVNSSLVNATVFDVMTENFNIIYNVYTYDVFVTGINGACCSWTYYVNHVFPSIACNHYKLDNDSIVEWKQV